MTVPFTYRIICPNGTKYYGVRYAIGCKPDDLWNTYFTSSKEVKALLTIFDKELFICDIRKVFNNKIDALSHEGRVLKRIVDKPGWLNKHKGDLKFHNSSPHSEETKRKISIAITGKKQSSETIEKRVKKNTGKKRINPQGHAQTEETKKKISKSRKGLPGPMLGKIHSEETRKKISIANSGKIHKPHSEETKAKMREAWIRRKTV